MAPDLSVIIPAYNAMDTLADAINAVLDPCEANVEVIVVDDGSTDGTQAWLSRFAEDAHVRVVTQVNQGPSSARNAGLAVARGDYVWFVDADDRVLPGAIDRQLSVLRKGDLDGLVIGATVSAEKGVATRSYIGRERRYFQIPPSVDVGICTGSQLFHRLFAAGYRAVGPYTRLYRRKGLVDANVTFPVGMIHEDCVFTVFAHLSCSRMQVVHEPGYMRRLRCGSLTQDRSAAARISSARGFGRAIALLQPVPMAADYIRYLFWRFSAECARLEPEERILLADSLDMHMEIDFLMPFAAQCGVYANTCNSARGCIARGLRILLKRLKGERI